DALPIVPALTTHNPTTSPLPKQRTPPKRRGLARPGGAGAMPRYVNDGNIKVAWGTFADKNFIALSELQLAEDIECHLTKDGLNITFRSEEHTSELQSRENLVCRLLLEKKNKMIK